MHRDGSFLRTGLAVEQQPWLPARAVRVEEAIDHSPVRYAWTERVRLYTVVVAPAAPLVGTPGPATIVSLMHQHVQCAYRPTTNSDGKTAFENH